jgi:hypothetical protein
MPMTHGLMTTPEPIKIEEGWNEKRKEMDSLRLIQQYTCKCLGRLNENYDVMFAQF